MEKDTAEAIQLLQLAAAQGCESALLHLGCAFYYGQGVEKDAAEGVRLARLAEAKGNTLAKSTLAEWGV